MLLIIPINFITFCVAMFHMELELYQSATSTNVSEIMQAYAVIMQLMFVRMELIIYANHVQVSQQI